MGWRSARIAVCWLRGLGAAFVGLHTHVVPRRASLSYRTTHGRGESSWRNENHP
jgi:hypothetical protein